MKIYYLIISIGILLLSCRELKTQEPGNGNFINSEIINSASSINLPIGNKDLIETNFPGKWQTYSFDNDSWLHTKYDSTYYKSDFFYDVFTDTQKNFTGKDSIIYYYNKKNIQCVYYDTFFPYNFMLSDYEEKLFPLWLVQLKSNRKILFLFSSDFPTSPDRTYISSYTKLKLAVLDDTGNILDFNNSYIDSNYNSKYFYMDEDEIIHVKYFHKEEEFVYFLRYEQYQISPQGKFIRYYDQDGELKNEEEQGRVKNHTREGKWVEMKPNGFTGSSTYLEAEYKEGLPVGEFKFYNLEQQYTDEGKPIVSTRKKGELLYTETYQNGELKERKFLKE
jgi:hypothetical protein